jgi:RimJ/RimL family protein N-acetyltransferase
MQANSASHWYWAVRTSVEDFAGIFDQSELNDHPDLGFVVPRHLWGKGFGFEGASAVNTEAWRRGIAVFNAHRRGQ